MCILFCSIISAVFGIPPASNICSSTSSKSSPTRSWAGTRSYLGAVVSTIFPFRDPPQIVEGRACRQCVIVVQEMFLNRPCKPALKHNIPYETPYILSNNLHSLSHRASIRRVRSLRTPQEAYLTSPSLLLIFGYRCDDRRAQPGQGHCLGQGGTSKYCKSRATAGRGADDRCTSLLEMQLVAAIF